MKEYGAAERSPLKANTDEALKRCPKVETVVVVKRTGGDIGWVEGRDVWYHEEMEKVSADCPPEEMDAEDPLFHTLYIGIDGPAQGRSGIRLADTLSMPQ